MNKNLKNFIFVIFDCVLYVGAWILSILILRRDLSQSLSQGYGLMFMLLGVILFVALNFSFKIYSILLHYAGFTDALKIVCVNAIMGIFNLTASTISGKLVKEWAILVTGIVFILMIASRFFYRFFDAVKTSKRKKGFEQKRVMIVGAGSAGSILIREMQTSEKYDMRPVCVLDDDPQKLNKYINGIKVVGTSDEVAKFAEKFRVQEIIIAMPSVNKKTTSKIVKACQDTKCKVKLVPGTYQLINGQVSVSDIKPVSISDLLGREQVKVNLDEIMGYIEGKIVMVTGGGGSIGSELCRQIASHNPQKLIILDIYENNAYEIEQELLRKHKNLNLLTLIASVRDKVKMDAVFSKYRPQIVFHAAAHKHVPLMETSPNEAVKNNVGGTLNVADCAGKYGVDRFILISTDKAVNPTNIMGATKRICEMIIQSMDKKYADTDYVAVRFGNVLGSNGSVIPLFKRQIEEGGPITVTHKDIIRYFMTIPEAVSLVLQAGAYAKGGEIFVLDMGDQVRIYDLAVNMIRLSGLTPFEDIDIKVTGLRPGEKLFEERLMAEEGLLKTQNEKISIGKPIEIDKDLFDKIDKLLIEAKGETEQMKDLVHQLVPTYVIDRRN